MDIPDHSLPSPIPPTTGLWGNARADCPQGQALSLESGCAHRCRLELCVCVGPWASLPRWALVDPSHQASGLEAGDRGEGEMEGSAGPQILES